MNLNNGLPNGTDIEIVSLNVNCLSRPASRIGLQDFLRTKKPDILCLQECNLQTAELLNIVRPVNYNCFSNAFSDENARGTAFIWKPFLEASEIRIIEEDRLMSVKFGGIVFINLYAHSGRGRRMERQRLFGEALDQAIRGMAPFKPIFMGDFNCIVENIDALNNQAQKKCHALSQVIRQHAYIDVYRHFNPQLQRFTFVRNNTGSRLDRIYVPDYLIGCVNSCSILPLAFTDHAAVSIQLEMAGVERMEPEHRPRNFWKLNNQILSHDDFLPNFSLLYNDLKQRINLFADHADWWELHFKPMTIQFLKQFSIMLARERKQTKEGFYILLTRALERGVDGYQESLLLKRQINNMLAIEAEGLKVRSRFKENHEKEKASLFHLARELKQGKQNNLEELLIDGNIESDPERCKSEVLNFYEPLLNGRHGRPAAFQMEEDLLPEFLTDDIRQLSDADKDSLDRIFTEEELTVCIKALPKNKSPGLDGLTNEFYKKVFNIIKAEYLLVQNDMTNRGYMSNSMRRGVTRLIPKVQGVPAVHQLRPITVLSADYGIRSRLITKRVSLLMEEIISSGQLCSNNKKNILTGAHNIFSTIEYINQKKLSAALLSFDMDKAFDRCYVPYVLRVMRHMNFSENFIALVKDMHEGATTRFIMHGLTQEVSLTFSIRQGDPFAMLMYIIYMEPFLKALPRELSGVQLAGFREIDEDYADDVEVVVEKDEDITRINELFSKFERVSGAILSRSNKSKVLGLGGWSDRQNWPLPWLKVEQKIKVFGFQILPTFQQILDQNWRDTVSNIRATIMSFTLRSLPTLQQRTDVLNIFILSKLWYKCQVLPLPSRYAREIEQLAGRYLWRGKLERLALHEIFSPPDAGGLGLVDIRTKADSLFIKQSCRVLSHDEGLAKRHVAYWLGLYMGNLLPSLRPGPHSERVPVYYVHFRRLFEEAVLNSSVDVANLGGAQTKLIYRGFTETLPPPKIVYKYDLPWDTVWSRINHPVLSLYQRELLFMLVHNILPTRERLHRLNQADNNLCIEGDGVETVEHLFCSCRRVQVAWAWMRRKIQYNGLALPGMSDFDLIHMLSGVPGRSVDLVWLISSYVEFVWREKTKKEVYFIDADKLRIYIQEQFDVNQKSQNKVSRNLF